MKQWIPDGIRRERMDEKMKKRNMWLSFVLAGALCLTPVQTGNAKAISAVGGGGTVSPCYLYTSTLFTNLSISGKSATITGRVKGITGTATKIHVKLVLHIAHWKRPSRYLPASIGWKEFIPSIREKNPRKQRSTAILYPADVLNRQKADVWQMMKKRSYIFYCLSHNTLRKGGERMYEL